jgi:hypothetical protein
MSAANSPKRRRTTPAPVSATVAKLVAQIHAEAEAATLEALSAKDGITVLQPLDCKNADLDVNGDHIVLRGADGGQLRYYRRHEEPEKWRHDAHMRGHWHPAYWNVYITRVDGNGQAWDAHPGRHVMDDFGGLVCVEHIAP